MKPIKIVGGGLAGLTLGIALRQRDVPVTIFEAGHYPRHRVCGEFISGRGQKVLQRLGLQEKLLASGARWANSAAFFSPTGKGFHSRLPEPALCLTRFSLDATLAVEFVKLGGELREGDRRPANPVEGTVRATGRRGMSEEGGWRWFGLKAHAGGVRMNADLEVHLLPQGYVGLCQLESGVVNVCGVFRSRTAIPDLAQCWPNWLRGEKGENPALRERMEAAKFATDSFCSVGGLYLAPQTACGHSDCCIGDAITMIAPLTGNGMSMAFESAELAAENLVDYSAGKSTWATATAEIALVCDRAFARRLRWSRWLQAAFFCRPAAEALLWLGSKNSGLWRALFRRTR